MALMMKILASVVGPSLLVYLGWRGIKPEQKKGALRVIFIMAGVIFVGTVIYVVVMAEMQPKWVAQDCAAAYEEIATSELAHEPTLARDPFLAGCNRLSPMAASCTRLSYARKFPASCRPYAGEIQAQLPKLDLGLAPHAQK
jgi:hypothetical protein